MTVKLKWVAFVRDVPSPNAPSVAVGNWLSQFDETSCSIVRVDDIVYITGNGTGATYAYPWARVAGAEEVHSESDDGTFVRPVAKSKGRK